MKKILIGRKKERAILQQALSSNESEMVAVIGRRRVGKTFLIENEYKDQIVFHLTGIQNAPLKEQLENFAFRIKHFSNSNLPIQTPNSWLNAFILLIDFLETMERKQKRVVFLDELPWMATRKSGFLRALGFFWNSWAINQNIVLVICGSAASWMIQKLINDKGGLHNRITRRIQLAPFTLTETNEYLQSRHIHFNAYQTIQLYMAMGGVPHYLKEIKGDKSATQNIDDICFSETGLLTNEFSRLYQSLFQNADAHIKIIKILASHRQGLTRKQIITIGKFSEGGRLSSLLTDLLQSDFIKSFQPFGKIKKNIIYRLMDEYSLFYLQFIEKNKHEGSGIWQHLSQTQPYKIWSGYAYENICLKHIPQIKKALGISGVYTSSSSFYKKGSDQNKGTQIDLVLDRNDQIINLFEIKYNTKEITISKEYAENLRNKRWVFQETTHTKKQIFITLITTFGLKHNQHSLGLIQQVLTMDDLFTE